MPLRLIGNAVDEFQELVARRRERPGEPIGYPSGFPTVDRLGGIVPASFTLVGGRPGIGKSAWSECQAWTQARLCMAYNRRHNPERPRIVCAYSLEQTEQVWLERQAVRINPDLDGEAYRSGEFTDEQWDALDATVNRLREAPLLINDSPSVTVADIAAELREINERYEVRLVVLDFLQRMKEIAAAGDGRFQKIGDVAEGLADIGKDITLGMGPEKVPVPMWVLSQVKAPDNQRPKDDRPIMTDLYGSRQLEAAARMVVFLYRQDYYHNGTPGYVPNGEAEFIVAKNNNGPTGLFKMAFDAKRVAFFERER